MRKDENFAFIVVVVVVVVVRFACPTEHFVETDGAYWATIFHRSFYS